MQTRRTIMQGGRGMHRVRAKKEKQAECKSTLVKGKLVVVMIKTEQAITLQGWAGRGGKQGNLTLSPPPPLPHVLRRHTHAP